MSFLNLVVSLKSKLISEKALDQAENYMIKPFMDFPKVRPDVTLVLGATAATAGLVLRAAELAGENMLGDQIVFTGKPSVLSDPIAKQLMTGFVAAGAPEPTKAAMTEGAYGAMAFREVVLQKTGKEPAIKIAYEANSTNTQQNFKEAAQLIELPKDRVPVIGILSVPNATRRAMMTAVREMGLGPAFVPFMGWMPEVGIAPNTWRANKLARLLVTIEHDKIKPTKKYPQGSYVARGFCLPIEPAREAERAVRIAKHRDAATL